VGTASNDTRIGGDGSDGVTGLAGNDVLYGRDGNDWVGGGVGADKLFGEAGDDVLYGGAGNDTLFGAAGADTFVYYVTSDSTAAATDVIRDFSAAQGDILDVSLVDANANLAGDQAFTLVGSFTGVPGQMTVSTVSTTSTVSFDTNGDGAADMVITVVGTLGSSWHL
jgi:serralysin